MLDREGRTECIGIHPENLAPYPSLAIDRCLQELHVVTPDERVLTGWDAVARLARLSPFTWLIGAVGAVPPFRWMGRVAVPHGRHEQICAKQVPRRRLPCVRARMKFAAAQRWAPLWTCYSIGFLLRLPSQRGRAGALHHAAHQPALAHALAADRPARAESSLWYFLNSFTCDLVSLMFGEQFLMLIYDGVAIDPGSTRMRRALERQLRRLPKDSIRAVAVTHHHEEHSCNLNWLSSRTRRTALCGRRHREPFCARRRCCREFDGG